MNNPQIRISRKVATIPVVAGGFSLTDLPRQYDYESLFLRINGGLQVTVLATSVRAEAPLQTIARVEVVADGKNTLVSVPGHAAAFGNLRRKANQSGARVATPPSGVAVATYQVEGNIAIDFASVGGIRPKDTNFRTSQLSLFQLRLTFGAAGDNFVGGTVAFSSMNVDVYTQELIELPNPNDKTYSSPIALRKQSYQEVTLAAANTNQEIFLPAGNLIAGILLRAEGKTTAGEPDATMLNNITVKAGEDYRLNLAAANLRAKNNLDYGAVTAGYYIHNPMALGEALECMTCAWDVSNQAQPKVVIDTTGGANQKLQVVTTELIMAS